MTYIYANSPILNADDLSRLLDRLAHFGLPEEQRELSRRLACTELPRHEARQLINVVRLAATNAFATIAEHAALIGADALFVPFVNALCATLPSLDLLRHQHEEDMLLSAVTAFASTCDPVPTSALRALAEHRWNMLRYTAIRIANPKLPEHAAVLRDHLARERLFWLRRNLRDALTKADQEPPWWIDRTGIDPTTVIGEDEARALRERLEPLFTQKKPFQDDASRQELLAILPDLPDPLAVSLLSLIARASQCATHDLLQHLLDRDGGAQQIVELTDAWSRGLFSSIPLKELTPPDARLADAALEALEALLPHLCEDTRYRPPGRRATMLGELLRWPQGHPASEQAQRLFDLSLRCSNHPGVFPSLENKLFALAPDLPWDQLLALDLDDHPDTWGSIDGYTWRRLMAKAPADVLEPLMERFWREGSRCEQEWVLRRRLEALDDPSASQALWAEVLEHQPDVACSFGHLSDEHLRDIRHLWATRPITPDSVTTIMEFMTRRFPDAFAWSETTLFLMLREYEPSDTEPLTEEEWSRWRALRDGPAFPPERWELALRVLPHDVAAWSDDDHAFLNRALALWRAGEPHLLDDNATRQLMLALITRDDAIDTPDVMEVYEAARARGPAHLVDQLSQDRRLIAAREEVAADPKKGQEIRYGSISPKKTIAKTRDGLVPTPWASADDLRELIARLRQQLSVELTADDDPFTFLRMSEEDRAVAAERATANYLLLQCAAFGHHQLLPSIAPLLLRTEGRFADGDRQASLPEVLPHLFHHAARAAQPPIEAFKQLMRSRSETVRLHVAQQLDPHHAEQVKILQRAFDKDGATDIKRAARKLLDQVTPQAWWIGIFSRDPVETLDEEQLLLHKETFEQLRELFAATSSLRRNHSALLEHATALPPELRCDLLTTLLCDTSGLNHSTQLLNTLIDTEGSYKALYKLVRTWALRRDEGHLHIEGHLSPRLTERRGAAPVQELAERLLSEVDRALVKAPTSEVEGWRYLFLSMAARLWASDADPTPIVDFIGRHGVPHPFVGGAFESAFERADPGDALLARLREVHDNGYPGGWTPKVWRGLISRAPRAFLLDVASGLLLSTDPETQQWAIEALIIGEDDHIDEDRFEQLLEVPETRDALLTSSKLLKHMFPRYRARLTQSDCTPDLAKRVMGHLQQLHPRAFSPSVGPLLLVSYKRTWLRDDQDKPLADPPDAPPTPEEWAAWRRIRKLDDTGPFPRDRAAWTDSDVALVQQALDRWRDEAAFTGYPSVLSLVLMVFGRDREDTDVALLDSILDSATAYVDNKEAIRAIILEMINAPMSEWPI